MEIIWNFEFSEAMKGGGGMYKLLRCLSWARPTCGSLKSSPVTAALAQRGSRWLRLRELQLKSGGVTQIFFHAVPRTTSPVATWWFLPHAFWPPR